MKLVNMSFVGIHFMDRDGEYIWLWPWKRKGNGGGAIYDITFGSFRDKKARRKFNADYVQHF